jgi:hypothetical protein
MDGAAAADQFDGKTGRYFSVALEYLRRNSNSFMYTDEHEIRNPGEANPFIEVDICCVWNGVFTIGEAKASERVDGGGRKERETLSKYKGLVVRLGARAFVLATTQVSSPATVECAENVFRDTNVRVIYLTATELKFP